MTGEGQGMPRHIDTGHGPLYLPVFFPDATRAVVRTVGSEDLEACGVRGLVVNVFHLSSRPGVGLIKSAGGIHPFMGWPQPVASDSGGFQLMSMIRENPKYGTVTQRGIHFTDMDAARGAGRGAGRKKVLFTPERSIRLQLDLGSDLVVCLDDCPSPDAAPDEVATAVDRTIQWAARCKKEFERLTAARDRPARPLLMGVIQGGYDRDQRRRCAEALLPLGFDGFGFGGWPLEPGGNLAADILAYTASLTPDTLPRWALGVGSPEHVVRCYDAGWHIFDCVLPTRDARHGRLYVWSVDEPERAHVRGADFYHFVYLRDDKHKRDYGPISAVCDCPTCRRYSLSYVHHLFEVDDPLALRLATMHNLRFYTQLMERLSVPAPAD